MKEEMKLVTDSLLWGVKMYFAVNFVIAMIFVALAILLAVPFIYIISAILLFATIFGIALFIAVKMDEKKRAHIREERKHEEDKKNEVKYIIIK